MQRYALLITLTMTLGSLVACAELPEARLFDFWESLGDPGEGFGADETGTSDGAVSDDGSGEGDGDAGDGDSGDGDDDGDGDGDPGDGETGDGDADAGDGDMACEPVSKPADVSQVPADIIFVLDNSSSMADEAMFVQNEMNGFSAQLELRGVDHHLVLISSYEDEGSGICIDAPLGNGACPDDDNNWPLFRHVNEEVGSNNALARLISTHHEWKGSIRPDAVKHVVVVSDDDSELGSNSFENQFLALDSSYDPFVFHAIVCPWECPEAGEIGQAYINLAYETEGVLGDLCQQDFETAFSKLADAVIQSVPLPCQFDIPLPPLGMSFDPSLINVELQDGNNGEDIPRVANFSDCVNHPDGWYYDDPANPVQIFLCPQTCMKAQEYEKGAVNVGFGCETLTG